MGLVGDAILKPLDYVRQIAVHCGYKEPEKGGIMAMAQRLEARITREEKKLLQEAATAKGLSLTAFVTSSAREAAVRTLQERHIIELGRRDQEIFVEALLNPETPNERLQAAAQRHGFRQHSRKR